MTLFNQQRLRPDLFGFDVERLRRGDYADQYFANIVGMLQDVTAQGYRFSGASPYLPTLDLSDVDIGNLEVEMQWFTRRKPLSVVAGVDVALALLQAGTGYWDDAGVFQATYDHLEVEAVHDGTLARYAGDPQRVEPVLKVRGRYRDVALLETPTLGILTRATRVATNVYNVLNATRGKPVLFFPARFDLLETQSADGYAYHVAVERYNYEHGTSLASFVSTHAQGAWWGGKGSGTMAHAAIAAFLADTAETMVQFAATRPPEVARIALVDFLNDCVGTTLEVMDALWGRYQPLVDAGNDAEAQKFKLAGVRPDTGGTMRDVSVAPLGAKELDMGVNPRLCFALRAAIDSAWQRWALEDRWIERAQAWCRDVKIVVTGGFGVEKIMRFEELDVPVDVYGVGSSLLGNSERDGTTNDFTADIVRVKLHGAWYDMAKVGRQPCDNPSLERIQ